MKEKTICRGDLFYYDFGTRTGSVQSGTRPVLVIQADDYNRSAPTIIVAAVTGVVKKRYLPSHILLGQEFGLKKPSMVLLEQLQTVNKDELRDYIGTIEDEQLLRRINITLSLFGKADRLLKEPCGDMLSSRDLGTFSTFQVRILLCHVSMEIILPFGKA